MTKIRRIRGMQFEEFDLEDVCDALAQNGYLVFPKAKVQMFWNEQRADSLELQGPHREEFLRYLEKTAVRDFAYRISESLALPSVSREVAPWGRAFFSAVRVVPFEQEELFRLWDEQPLKKKESE